MVIAFDVLKTAADLIKNAKNIVAFTGAGISTPSGIPDFRSPTSGMWEQVDPMAVASLQGFRQNPQRFYNWVRPLAQLTLQAVPNPAHRALVTLEQHGKLAGVITQNIDMLHHRAGNNVVYELHGHLREATCLRCYHVVPAPPMIEKFLVDGCVPKCECGGILKPNVILFGEQLPYKELQGAQDAARKCDLMMIIGSSLEVAPASDLPLLAKRNGAKLMMINLEPTMLDRVADVVIHADAAVTLPAILERLEM